MSRMVCKVLESAPVGRTTDDMRRHLEKNIQGMLDDGWTLRAALPRSVSLSGVTMGAFLIFVRKERGG
jgi:hypothetical protein